MKKLLGIIVLGLLLSGNAYSNEVQDQKVLETISMKCKYFTYKIDREKDYATVYKKNEASYWEIYAERSKIDEKTILPETTSRSEKSIEIGKGGYRLETYVKHSELTNGICNQCKIILDFKKLRKKGKGNWNGKPYNLNEKCKLTKS